LKTTSSALLTNNLTNHLGGNVYNYINFFIQLVDYSILGVYIDGSSNY